METVYRVEHAVSGRGPYTMTFGQEECYGCDDPDVCDSCQEFQSVYALVRRVNDHADTLGDHPLPYRDGIPSDELTRDHLFGFRSHDELRDWFDGSILPDLLYNGFIIREYAAEEIIYGEHQVAFIPA
jgi:hypothetical protein